MELGQSVVQIEHPERVVWYERLVQEWTGQVPHVMVANDGQVAAWVTPYSSKGGFWHPAPTQVWGMTMEHALEGLTNAVYEDLQMDLACLVNVESADRQAMAGLLTRS